jgi:hypothetical protein
MTTDARARAIVLAIALSLLSSLAESFSATPPSPCASGTILARGRNKDMLITLMNQQGRLIAGNNDLCVEFRKLETREPADVQNLSVDFRLLVGRIQGIPIKAQVARDGVSSHRCHVNLGRQYYKPANYYVFVRYLDLAGRKRKKRFLLTVE